MCTYRSAFAAAALAASLAACSAEDPAGPGSETAPVRPELATAPNTWRIRANLPTPRVLLGAAVVPDAAGHTILYAIGGRSFNNGNFGGSQSKVNAYDPVSNTWRIRAPLPQSLLESNGAVVIGGKIYLSGGIPRDIAAGASQNLYVYDPIANTWSRKRDLPVPSFGGVSGAIDGKLYVLTSCRFDDPCGGAAIDMVFYRYDPATDGWTALPTPPDLHHLGSGGTIGKRLYVTAGFGILSAGVNHNSALDVYDPASNTWASRAPLPVALAEAAGATVDAKLYLTGGAKDFETTRETRVYDPATDRWSNLQPLPHEIVNGAAARVVAGGKARLEVVGGDGSNNLQYTP